MESKTHEKKIGKFKAAVHRDVENGRVSFALNLNGDELGGLSASDLSRIRTLLNNVIDEAAKAYAIDVESDN